MDMGGPLGATIPIMGTGVGMKSKPGAQPGGGTGGPPPPLGNAEGIGLPILFFLELNIEPYPVLPIIILI